MARKVLNRKELRAESEAAEKAEAAKPKTAKKKAATKRKTRKAAEEVRLKKYWGVFSQSMKRVALYEFHQKKDAEARAEELSKSGKSPHFVSQVKEAVSE
jgi:hypothetical protein